MDAGDDDTVVARRLVLPAATWRVLRATAEAQGIEPMVLAAKAVQAGLGIVSQTPAKPLIERLDELPDDGDDEDAWLEGL